MIFTKYHYFALENLDLLENKRNTNSKIKITQTASLSNNWRLLNTITFGFFEKYGAWITQKREVYDRGNGAGILIATTTNKFIARALETAETKCTNLHYY